MPIISFHLISLVSDLVSILFYNTSVSLKKLHYNSTVLDIPLEFFSIHPKVFDRVWHDGLIYKLILHRFPHHLIRLLQSYFTDRIFHVSISGISSDIKPISAGVPQGSVLGISFLISTLLIFSPCLRLNLPPTLMTPPFLHRIAIIAILIYLLKDIFDSAQSQHNGESKLILIRPELYTSVNEDLLRLNNSLFFMNLFNFNLRPDTLELSSIDVLHFNLTF